MSDRTTQTTELEIGEVVLKRGRVYWSTGLIALAVGFLTAVMVARSELGAVQSQQKEQAAQLKGVATKEDIAEIRAQMRANQTDVTGRIDGVYNLIIQGQERRGGR